MFKSQQLEQLIALQKETNALLSTLTKKTTVLNNNLIGKGDQPLAWLDDTKRDEFKTINEIYPKECDIFIKLVKLFFT
jgi:hypothetical protein